MYSAKASCYLLRDAPSAIHGLGNPFMTDKKAGQGTASPRERPESVRSKFRERSERNNKLVHVNEDLKNEKLPYQK